MTFRFLCYRTAAPIYVRNYHAPTTPASLLRCLELSGSQRTKEIIEQCHAQVFSHGYGENLFLATKLISIYAARGATVEAKLVFDGLRQTSACVYNSLINGFVKIFAYGEVFWWFNSMCRSGLMPDGFALSAVSKASGETGNIRTGKTIHGKIVKSALTTDAVVANSIMSMYRKCGQVHDCMKLFDEMPHRSIGSWNVVLSGFMASGKKTIDADVLQLVKGMDTEGLRPNSVTLSTLLCMCRYVKEKGDHGRELHAYSVRNEFALPTVSDLHLFCCLIDMYGRSGRVSTSRLVFDKMQTRNIFTWTAMINCYGQNGEMEQALGLFREMQRLDQLEPNLVSLLSVLPICSSLCCLVGGKQVHGYAIRKKLDNATSLCNALIDMYCKCGRLTFARNVFDSRFFCRDSISWSSILCGYGMHGEGTEAVMLYNQMLELDTRPDPISVLGVLTACSKAGLITEGVDIYYASKNQYGVEPTVEICACIVDMLARSGQLDQAFEFIKSMPMEPGPSVWGSLLSSSILHGNSEMRDLAYRFLNEVEPGNPSNYVSLSNSYASSRRWNSVANIRATMKEFGMQKTPGCSWITIHNSTYSFYATDKVQLSCEFMYELINGLRTLMKEPLDFQPYDNMI